MAVISRTLGPACSICVLLSSTLLCGFPYYLCEKLGYLLAFFPFFNVSDLDFYKLRQQCPNLAQTPAEKWAVWGCFMVVSPISSFSCYRLVLVLQCNHYRICFIDHLIISLLSIFCSCFINTLHFLLFLL